MSQIYWVGGSGDQPWTTAANWSTGAVPVTGDDVYLLAGDSDINTGLAQSAVQLASLNVGSGFTGTVGVAGDSGAFLAIGATVFRVFPAPADGGFVGGGPSRLKIDFGTTTYTGVVQTSGSAADTGRGAVQLKGGSSSSTLYVTGGTVDVAAIPGATATLALLEVSGGTVTTGSGLTCPAVSQRAGSGASGSGPQVVSQAGTSSTLLLGGPCTTLTQTAGTLYTSGAGLIGTAKIGGEAVFGNRPASGNAFTNLTIDGSGSVDFSEDPRPCLLANGPTLYRGAGLTTWSKTQVQLAGPAALQVALVDCGVGDVSLNLGSNLTLTVA